MKNWLVGVLSAGGTAVLALIGGWGLGVFEAGTAALDEAQIEAVLEKHIVDEAQIKAILDEKLQTASGETYGQVLVATRDEVIVLRTKVEVLERALNVLTQ